jgi:hypothetical protein
MHMNKFTFPVHFVAILDVGKCNGIPNLDITDITNAYQKKWNSNRFLHYSSGFARHYQPNLRQNRIKRSAAIKRKIRTQFYFNTSCTLQYQFNLLYLHHSLPFIATLIIKSLYNYKHKILSLTPPDCQRLSLQIQQSSSLPNLNRRYVLKQS